MNFSNNVYSIKCIWIPSQKGIRENEKADELAKLATTKPPSIETKVPFTDLKTFLKTISKNNTIDTVVEQRKC